jgi:DNA-binding NarL/FixJ family response regulator
MKLILADDAALLRQGLARLLEDAGFEITAQVADGRALIETVRENPPDVAIVDIRMPPTFTDEGLVAAREIHAAFPGVGVLVLSQHIDVAYAMTLLNQHTDRIGYLLKDRVAELETLTDALQRIHAGQSVIDPALVSELVSDPRSAHPLAELTAREQDVLALLAEGRTDRGIAETLWITPKTAETHVRNIFRKLDLPNAPTENRRVHAVLTFLGRPR